MILILDYGIGNLRSLANALQFCEIPHKIGNNKEDILAAQGVIIPGVGAFAAGMENLIKLDLLSVVQERIAQNKPTLGICLGFQLLCKSSSEFGLTDGIGCFETTVEKISTAQRLPHIGWNTVKDIRGTHLSELYKGVENEKFYFVHSFCAQKSSLLEYSSSTIYGGQYFISSACLGNVFGVQFHPEKSSTQGLKILKNFYDISRGES